MLLSDISVKRPVFATVLSLLLIAFGLVSFTKLPLREYPDIDPPVVSINTSYRGAASTVVETRVTKPIEDRIAGVEGMKSIASTSSDGNSRITINFNISRNIDDAANDVRDRVSGILAQLPEEADAPEIQKANADDDVILWFSLSGEGMSMAEISDYAKRYVVDQFSSLDGVSRVRIGGGQEQAMRIWLDRNALAARNLTVEDIENALLGENVELPAGTIESTTRDFTVRMQRGYNSVTDFKELVISRGTDGYLVRLGDVARVEVGAIENRSLLSSNGTPMVGIGIIKQSKGNTLDVAVLAKQKMEELNKTLPSNMKMLTAYDSSVFIDRSVHEVYLTLYIAMALVVLVIYVFLGSLRATLIPAVTVPVSLISTFIILFAFGYTLNLLTLLALILAIGLVVDDAIVVIENIHRRIEQGEPRMVAAFRGTRQVGFAVIATTIVLVSVFMPITFMGGDVGRLFSEFAVTISAAVLFSGFVALTLSPMMSSKILEKHGEATGFAGWVDKKFNSLRDIYINALEGLLERPAIVIISLVAILAATVFLFREIPREFAPKEDRGVFYIMIQGPEGASYNYIMEHVNEVEKRLQPFIESGEFRRVMMRAPRSFGTTASFNDAIGVVMLADWGKRKPASYYMGQVMEMTKDIPGVQIFPIMRQSFGGGIGKPVQFVLGGPTYEALAEWRDIMMAKSKENPKILGMTSDYLETKPQIGITINRDSAGDLGIPVSVANRTLETMLGSRRVTTYIDRGEEYDVMLESEKDLKSSPLDISNLYVRSQKSQELIPLSNIVNIKEFADAANLNRYNRLRSITLEAGLGDDYSLGDALEYLENLAGKELPGEVHIDYKGQSQQYKESGGSIFAVFALALVVVFLVLSGQFESFVHPLIIMFTVPLAIVGALLALWLTGQTLNIYSQIGLIILVGIAAKNGILIVEFTNQLRDEGKEFYEAILEASGKRLRPILMTSATAAMGAIPLIFSTGAGAETRRVIGIVIFSGVVFTTIFTIFVVPTIYRLLAKNTQPPETNARKLEEMLGKYKEVR